MAIIDVLKFRGIMLRGGFPEAPAEEFVEAFDETLEQELAPLATKADLERWKSEIVSQLENKVEKLMLAQEARHSREMLFWFLGVTALIGTALAILALVN